MRLEQMMLANLGQMVRLEQMMLRSLQVEVMEVVDSPSRAEVGEARGAEVTLAGMEVELAEEAEAKRPRCPHRCHIRRSDRRSYSGWLCRSAHRFLDVLGSPLIYWLHPLTCWRQQRRRRNRHIECPD